MADSGNDRKHAHELIDKLEPTQVSAVVPLLQFMLLDPVSRSMASASVERDCSSQEEIAALDEARVSLERGQGIRHEDVLREFGLSPK